MQNTFLDQLQQRLGLGVTDYRAVFDLSTRSIALVLQCDASLPAVQLQALQDELASLLPEIREISICQEVNAPQPQPEPLPVAAPQEEYIFAMPEQRDGVAELLEAVSIGQETALIGQKPVTGKAVPMAQVWAQREITTKAVVVEGSVLCAEERKVRTFGKGNFKSKESPKTMLAVHVTDKTSTLELRISCDAQALPRYLGTLKKGQRVRMQGKVIARENFREEMEYWLEPEKLTLLPALPTRTDDAPEKRVELHLHTQMSSMDGMTDLAAAVKTAAAWGHPALAVTDHGVVQAFPDALKLSKKFESVKLIYGLEGYLVDDTVQMVEGADERSLAAASVVVFDLETTGLSASTETIIEIGAVKLREGVEVDSFQTMVNPGRPISAFISNLTGITDAMVADAPKLESILPEFMAFCEGCTLCAHNASFDMKFLRRYAGMQGFAVKHPVIDTVSLARSMFPNLRNHKLDTVAKHLGVDMGSHHRAKDDARTAAAILTRGMAELQRKGATTLRQANQTLGGGAGQIKSLPMRHVTLLVRSQTGVKNLYKLVTDAHLEHFYRKPRIAKSQLIQHREGLLVGSACSAGDFFGAVIDGASDDKLDDLARFYDFLEIMPLANNDYLVRENESITAKTLQDFNRRVIEVGRRLGIPVVATGDVHHLNEEDVQLRRILLHSLKMSDALQASTLHLRTTQEMLEEFSYLGEDTAYEVVVKNTRVVADSVDKVSPFTYDDFFPPKIDGAEEEVRRSTLAKAKEVYGDPLPEVVQKRLDKELTSIIDNGFSVLYSIAQQLVAKSLSDGYLVGSRGSVGSSLVATFMGITEVNPLPPHYYCSKCKYVTFDVQAGIGHDLPAADCPQCGHALEKDGYDIPFEVFLGFKGDKIPDIDLNFSGEYQPVAHRFIEELFGAGHVFRAGTISTVADKTAEHMVREYAEAIGADLPPQEVTRLANGITGVKRTTGQHPGGIIILPKDKDMLDFCPLQHPADSKAKGVITTHFDFHSIDSQLVKLDILGHDDPSMLRMLHDLTGYDPRKVPLDDPETMALFTSPAPLGLTPQQIGSEVGTMGLPEFGTPATRKMVEELRPTTQAELVRISGLSHGEGIWVGNAQELVKKEGVTITDVLCTRDDIMNQLIEIGLPPLPAFKIMESVRKGKGLSADFEKLMREHRVPEWLIDSCKKIKYMFPKAHAAAYVMMGFRIGYYKVHFPLEYYASYFTVRADEFDAQSMLGDIADIRARMAALGKQRFKLGPRENNILTILEIVHEMRLRGFDFLPVDIHRSDATRFTLQDGALRPPLTALPKLGLTVAVSIQEARKDGDFLSVEDLRRRTRVNKAVQDVMDANGCFAGMSQTNQLSFF